MNEVTWLSGAGELRVDAETIVSSSGLATKLYTGVKNTNVVTMEAWIDPVKLTQNGPARRPSRPREAPSPSALHHVVYTRDAAGNVVIYIDIV